MITDIERFDKSKHTADQHWDWGVAMSRARYLSESTGRRYKVYALPLAESWMYVVRPATRVL